MRDKPAIPGVFVDVSIMKLAADRVVRGFKRSKTIRWGERQVTLPLTQFRVVPHLPKRGTPLWDDAIAIRLIAALAKRGRVELLWHLDAALEFGRLPNIDSPRGRFYGAPLTWVKAPAGAGGGRVLADGGKSMKQHQLDFVRSLRNHRFLEIARAAGATPDSGHYDNQLLDSLHLWTAEHVGARYFLTTDYKLCRTLAHYRGPPLRADTVTPRKLLRDLARRREISAWDLACAMWEGILSLRRSRRMTGTEELAVLGERLEAQGYYD